MLELGDIIQVIDAVDGRQMISDLSVTPSIRQLGNNLAKVGKVFWYNVLCLGTNYPGTS